jgi:hypothetical protein
MTDDDIRVLSLEAEIRNALEDVQRRYADNGPTVVNTLGDLVVRLAGEIDALRAQIAND